MAGPHTARARARAQMLEQIKREALAQLAAEGAPSLSLRQIARELGLVSSGLYRYFASRDELLTALIVDAYADLARAIEVADAGLEQHEYRRRWLLRCPALRSWARSEPARYHLHLRLTGAGLSGPAGHDRPGGRGDSRAAAGAGRGGGRRSAGGPAELPATRSWSLNWSAMGEALALDLPVGTLAQAIGALGEVFGLLALELGGHLVGGFEPADSLFGYGLNELADRIGLPESTSCAMTPTRGGSKRNEGTSVQRVRGARGAHRGRRPGAARRSRRRSGSP